MPAMNVFEMVVIIVLITIGAGVINNYIKHRNQAVAEDDEADWQKRLELMEERLRVLEKIVTDRDYELKQKFRDL